MAMTNAERQKNLRDRRRAVNPPKEKEPKIMTEKQLIAEVERYRRNLEKISERTLYAIQPLSYYLEQPRGYTARKLANFINYVMEGIGEPEPEFLEAAILPDAVMRPIQYLMAWGMETARELAGIDWGRAIREWEAEGNDTEPETEPVFNLDAALEQARQTVAEYMAEGE